MTLRTQHTTPSPALAFPAWELSGGQVALCAELAAESGAPEWVQLLPAGAEVGGRDGRKWSNDRPREIVAAFKRDFSPIPIDVNHATEMSGLGFGAPAVGWIEELEARDDGSLWGRVKWNPQGAAAVAERQYRYLSPVFRFDPETKNITQLYSAALTNRPNLRLAALNTRETDSPNEESMNKKLLAALGLPETATEDQALNAIESLKTNLTTAKNQAETPSLERFVPRADYDAAMNRAKKAEDTLTTARTAEQEGAIATAVNAAVAEGKVTPASKEFYLAACRQEGGLKRFEEFAKGAPKIAADPALKTTQPGNPAGGALSADELAVCNRMGLTPEAFTAARA